MSTGDYIFRLRDEETLRSYPVAGTEVSTFETVWNSQKCWFTKGTSVTIIAPDGSEEHFIKE